jgi:hypothetical protein
VNDEIIPDLPKGGLDYCDCHANPEKGTFKGYLRWAFRDHVRAMVDYDSDTDNLEVIKHYRLQRILKERKAPNLTVLVGLPLFVAPEGEKQ